MSSVALHHDEDVVAATGDVLQRLRERSPSLRYATVLTDDGFEVASVRAGATADGSRFAGIASSLQMLGEAAASELISGAGAPTVLVSDEAGHLVQVRAAGTTLVVSALFDGAEGVGQALSSARRGADEISVHVATST
ncbi:roadblock/LC7 domain-containing protein [Microbacterium sp. KUDC0406]|uniref:roadblock/LC7 domain-containing protein n=1 Tax=Microbacterium sp. KUDC0406 TaxID=2909588 RepID=UPI001F3D2894|nr:roadblock/LC7 domain-containing protein [Microbacterium sp. KUDC0406]UJP10270.1 roadblock/LC7 domain-containing protein [Microbacterium sp. KUDC0406]